MFPINTNTQNDPFTDPLSDNPSFNGTQELLDRTSFFFSSSHQNIIGQNPVPHVVNRTLQSIDPLQTPTQSLGPLFSLSTTKPKKVRKLKVVLRQLDKDLLLSIYKIYNITHPSLNYTTLRITFLPIFPLNKQVIGYYNRLLVNNSIPDVDSEFAWEKVIDLFSKGHIFKNNKLRDAYTFPPDAKKLQQYVEKGISYNSNFCRTFQEKILRQIKPPVIVGRSVSNDVEILNDEFTPQISFTSINSPKDNECNIEKNKSNEEVIDIEDSVETSDSDADNIDRPVIYPRPTTLMLTPKVNKREREEDFAQLKESKLSPISEHADGIEFSVSPESIVQENTSSQNVQNREISPELIEKIIKLIKTRLKVENDVSRINWDWVAELFEQSAETIFCIWEKYLIDNSKWRESDEPLLQLVNFSLEALEGKGIDWDWISEGLKSKSYQPTPQECQITWQQMVSNKLKN